jgi:hypothetical protein
MIDSFKCINIYAIYAFRPRGRLWLPLRAWFEHDGRVIHIEWSVIGRAVGSIDGTEDRFDFRECANDPGLFFNPISQKSQKFISRSKCRRFL